MPGGSNVTAPAAVTLAIVDDEPTPTVTLELSVEAIGENGGSATVTARLDHPSSAATTLTLAAVAVAPAAAADFTLSGSSLTIAAGATTSSGTATITAVDNDADTLDKEVSVSASAANVHGVTAPAAVTLAIVDDEQAPAVTLELSAEAISENGGSATVTARLDHPSSAATTLTLAAVSASASASAAAAADFTLSGSSLTIAAGATASSDAVTITAVDNDVDTPHKEVLLSATAANSHGVAGDPPSVTLAIIDDEGAPTLTLELSAEAIGENGGFGTVTAKLNHPSSAATTVMVAAAPVAPALATDFTLHGDSLTIAAGATASSGAVMITAVDNDVDAPDKRVTVSGSVPGGSNVTAPAAVTLAIVDDEQAPAVTLLLSAEAIGENGGSATVTARLDHPSSAATTLTLAAVAVAPAAATDFTLSGSSLTIAAGATTSSGTATITVVDNDADTLDKEVLVSASAANVHGVTAPPAVTLTIVDTDDTDAEEVPAVRITSAAEFPASAKFTVVIEFPEPVTGLTLAEIRVTGGAAGDLRGSGASYTVEVTPPANVEGVVTVSIAAGAARYDDGRGNEEASADFAVDTRAPTVLNSTLDLPLEQWTAPADTGASHAGGVVAYPRGGSRRGFAAAIPDQPAAPPAAPPGHGDAAALTLTWDEALDESSTPPVGAFTVRVDGGRRLIAAVAVRGNRVRLTLAAPVTSGRTTTVSYTVPAGAAATPIRDLAGNAAGDLSGASVSSGVTQAAPEARYLRVNRALLPYLAVTMHAGTLAAVSERIAAARARIPPLARLRLGAAGNLARTGLEPGAAAAWAVSDAGPRLSLEQLLDGTDFVVPLAGAAAGTAPGGPAVAVWGSGDYRGLSGDDSEALDWSGDLLSVHLGADLRVTAEVLAGVAVSWSRGKFDYTDATAARAVDGGYRSDLLSVHPYASWSVPGVGLSLWMTAGYGWGEVRIDDELSAEQSGATRLLTAAVGVSGRLLATDALIAGGTTALRLKGDGSLARIEVAASGPIAALELDTRRLRLLLEGSHAQTLPWGGRLTPALEVGLRYDAGAGPEGAGLELGAELSYADPGLGLTVQGHGRLLATHGTGYQEWGAGGLLRLGLGVDRQGLTLSVAPSWGAAASAAPMLWERGVAGGVALAAAGGQSLAGRVEAEVGYGLPVPGGQGVLIPYGGLTLAAEGARDYRVGTRLELPALGLSLEGHRREGGAGLAEHGVTLRGGLRY